MAGRVGTVRVDNDGVTMTVARGFRLRHVSDIPGPDGVCFGGDTMGHWNVSRINRMLDAFDAPTRQLQIPHANMIGIARVGAPDMARVKRYVEMGLATMPPLSFVAIPRVDGDSLELMTLLVDGHHRMMALALIGVLSVPARVLPPTLVDDVRIIEMSEFVTFPEATFAGRRVDAGGMA